MSLFLQHRTDTSLATAQLKFRSFLKDFSKDKTVYFKIECRQWHSIECLHVIAEIAVSIFHEVLVINYSDTEQREQWNQDLLTSLRISLTKVKNASSY